MRISKRRGSTASDFRRIVASIFSVFFVGFILAPCITSGLVIERQIVSVDAIIVLAGAPAIAERTKKAAEEYKRGIATTIVLTNDGEQGSWSNKEAKNPAYVELARSALIANGVPFGAIEILRPKVSGTIVEAQLLNAVALERHWQAVMIVTSSYHTRRAHWIFERVFAQAGNRAKVGIVHPDAKQVFDKYFWWMSWRRIKDISSEYVKFLYYLIMYS